VPDAFAKYVSFLEANRVLASSLVLQLGQSVLRGLGAREQERLARLADLGFRFSLDRVIDLALEPGELAGRGVRFIKVAASVLLDRGSVAAPVRPADLAELLGRFGIDLIAVTIEREETVAELIDLDIRLGQGFLFSPHAVRGDALEAASAEAPHAARPAGDSRDASPARSRARAELARAAAALKPK
jgi:cyclic-di-GMP phosphodiesterase TipF (flagellum assembly factor)